MTEIKIGDWANHFTARFQKPEIAAGHRIDTPQTFIEHCQQCADEVAAWPESKRKAASVISVTALNATKSPYSNDLPQDGSMVQGEEKEAVIANGEDLMLQLFRKWLQEEIGISGCYKTYSDEFLRGDAQDMYAGAKWAWQHQQGVVDQREADFTRAKSSLLDAVREKEELRDEVEYQKAERKREQDAAWSTHDEQVRIIRQLQDEIEGLKRNKRAEQTLQLMRLEARKQELQKRVGAVQALVADWEMKEMSIKTEYSRGKLHGLYDCKKELEKALGADHETP